MRFYIAPIPFLLLILAACNSSPPVYTPPPSASGRLCAARCGDAHFRCQDDCNLARRECLNKAEARALIDYERYTGTAFLHDAPLDFTESDFERLGSCKDELDRCMPACEPAYQACYEKCGGTVE